MNSNGKNTELNPSVEQIRQLIYPEGLEVSKVCSILTDELNFKVDDFYSLKEISKVVSSKENLIDILNTLASEKLLKLNDKGEGQILISDEFTLFNFINIPNKLSREELLKALDLEESQIKRLYKQSLYWVLVSEIPETNAHLEKLLKQFKLGDVEIKHDQTSNKMIRKLITKKIHHFNYMKETDDLKACSPNGARKDSVREKLGSNASEHFSWRKKSDLSTNSKDENSGKKDKPVSSFNPSSQFPRRERFNSDPHTKTLSNNNDEINENVVIDPKQVKYSLKVDYKYSSREMVEFFDKIKDILSKNPTNFNMNFEEVCNSKIKSLSSVNQRKSSFESYRKDRSGTFTSGYEFKSSLNGQAQEKVFIPRNNPLQDIKINANVNK